MAKSPDHPKHGHQKPADPKAPPQTDHVPAPDTLETPELGDEAFKYTEALKREPPPDLAEEDRGKIAEQTGRENPTTGEIDLEKAESGGRAIPESPPLEAAHEHSEPEPTIAEGLIADAQAHGGAAPVERTDSLDQAFEFGLTPDPNAFLVPEPVRLTKGQIGGLQKEGLEAYLFGERVRHDASGRRWDFRREAENGLWSLIIRVQIGPALLAKAGLTLDRIPTAEGEHRLLQVIEGMVEQAVDHQRYLIAEQKKLIHDREVEARANEKRQREMAEAEKREQAKPGEVDHRADKIAQEEAEADAEKAQAGPAEKAWKDPDGRRRS